MVTATHQRGVFDNAYAKTYAALQERDLPLGFPAMFTWSDQSLRMMNRFIGVPALGFTWYNMLHLPHWLVNGLMARFPRLNPIWLATGLACVPFLLHRTDNQYLMRPSDAPT